MYNEIYKINSSFSFILDFYSDINLSSKLKELLVVMLKYDNITDRTHTLIRNLNNIYQTLMYDVNIQDKFRSEDAKILSENLKKEGFKPFSRLVFNLSNLNFIDNLKQNKIKNKEEISPFVRLSLYSLFDTKIDNKINEEIIQNYDFQTLNIIKNDSEIRDKVKIFNRIRNALAHDQFYIFKENDKLYFCLENKSYFKATIELDELFSLFDLLLDNPIDSIDFNEEKQNKILADELLLNLIFNSNKDHFLTKYREVDYEKLDASGFDSDWINAETEKEKELSRKIFKFKSTEDEKKFYQEYGVPYEKFSFKNKFRYLKNKLRLVREPRYTRIQFGNSEYLVDFLLMSYDKANNLHIPNFVLLTKLRNAVAHGHYDYYENEDIFVFYDKKGNNHANFNTFITREDLETFLNNPLFLETLLMPEASLAVERYQRIVSNPLFKMLSKAAEEYSYYNYDKVNQKVPVNNTKIDEEYYEEIYNDKNIYEEKFDKFTYNDNFDKYDDITNNKKIK